MGGGGKIVASPLLTVSDVTKRFGGVLAVDSVSFQLTKGEIVGIIGPNGSGKTTLVNIITGFIRPDKGKVVFKGKNITKKQPYHIADMGIARSFQMVRPFYQLPAFKNLIPPLFSPRVKRLVGGKYGDRDAVAMDILEEVGFERDSSVPYKSARNLPHGYLKRLELGRCIAMRPEVIVLDEIFSGMSIAEVTSTVPIIERLRDEGIAIVMIEHRLRELFQITDHVIVLNYGQKIADGTPEAVMASSQVKKAYLGSE